jgi:mono/diheme cytochrome c family protein
MWSLRWRYDPQREAGRRALQDLVTALLALSDPPEPYREAWARPGLRWRTDCAACHRPGTKQPVSAGKDAHRCAYLGWSDHLRCERCHAGDPPAGPAAGGSAWSCPQVKAAEPQCTVCHRRRAGGGMR